MSNSLAIAAVTETLRQLLDRGINAALADDPSTDVELAGTSVTTRPPDKARGSLTGNQLNLFLCQTMINSAWRNQDLPRQVKPGESGRPPLPLNLTYLITAFGADDDGAGILSHRLLGRAMSILHDSAVLNRKDIQTALLGNNLYEQIDAIHLTFQTLSMEEIAKLWTAFQTPYRISSAYQVTVVLIESNIAVRAPLPVLQRGQEDRGPHIAATPPASLLSVQGEWVLPIQPPPGAGPITRRVPAPGAQAIARLGDRLVVSAQNLPDSGVRLRLSNPYLPNPFEFAPLPGSRPGELRFDLPGADQLIAGVAARNTWPGGYYSLALVVQQTGLPDWVTNELPFLLAPGLAITPLTAPNGEVVLSVECSPRLRPEQERRVFLIFGSRQLAPESITTPGGSPSADNQPTTLVFRFTVPADQTGLYTIRLRVDGVDSLPFAAPNSPGGVTALIFDPQQQVTIT